MTAALKAFVSKHIVAEVKDEMDACLDCNVAQCLSNRYLSCPHRLEHAAAQSAARHAAVGQQGSHAYLKQTGSPTVASSAS